MHDGSIRALDDAVEHFANGGWYQRGGKPERAKDTDPLVKSIFVPHEQRRPLKTFVKLAFQGEYPVVENPFVKPKAAAGGSR
jgi:hypothetical protein